MPFSSAKNVKIRPYNFSAGPAARPQEVLTQAAAEMLDWRGSGMGVMEMSHRGREFVSIYSQAQADLRELLDTVRRIAYELNEEILKDQDAKTEE